ncbi:MAG: Maf family protein [Planctomycetota bacterium]|jgi:septum formation protein
MNAASPFLVLASSSPRRSELLAQAGYRFAVEPVDVDESDTVVRRTATLAQKVRAFALAKASARASLGCSASEPGMVILGADTLVQPHGGGAPIGKPSDRAHAREMIRRLEGRWRRVLSGVALLDPAGGSAIVFSTESQVRIAPPSPDELERYLDSELWRGKAGGFGIQDETGLAHELRGSYSNVVGLPLEALAAALAGRAR